ncbi:hypothetical protein [Nocardioides sp. Kera G14]|uniref:hypothetical protein n=1 Tax=Nocardioides sp. Kera G14 TaxID=2884264 RepID=UPI001D112CBF|nr:hypothetical protein [Nocardioides sp. Kera G14]UDY24550.1 hypothetical protein LH076_04395 [Nocardioides sp. Kera G14]
MTRPLFVHLGTSKSGTSSLQAGIWNSVEAMAAAGVGLPFRTRGAHLDGLLRPLGWRPVDAFDGAVDEALLAGVPARLRETPGDLLLVTNEDLAEVGPSQAARIVELASEADLEVHLVLTMRGWADQIPSEYQQFIKHRMTLTYPEFLGDVRRHSDGSGGEWAERYWRRQDPGRILDAWAGLVPAERTHVISVPPFKVDPDGVFRMMGEAVGFDDSVIERPTRALNSSYGVVEAEVWRRVNLALGDRLPDFVRDYGRNVRYPFVLGSLPTQASARFTLPPEELGWVTEYAQRSIDELRSRAYVVHGDLDGLLPREGVAKPLVVPTTEEVAEAAVKLVADFAVYTSGRVERIRAQGHAQGRASAEAEKPRRRRWLR